MQTRSLGTIGLIMTLPIVAAACTNSPNLVRYPSPSTAPPAPVSIVQEDVRVNVSSAVIQSARASDTDIAPIVRQALRRITHLLPGLDVRVDVGVNPKDGIREIGVVGRTDPNTGDVTIALDPAFRDFETTLRVWLPVTLAHELDHAQRINSGPGVGHTLLDAMVFEGVADAFSIQAFPQTPPIPWDHALSLTEEKAAWRQAKGKLNLLLDMSEYRSWFLGMGPVPRWTGYTLGFRIVSGFLERHPHETAASITSFAANRILQGSGLGVSRSGRDRITPRHTGRRPSRDPRGQPHLRLPVAEALCPRYLPLAQTIDSHPDGAQMSGTASYRLCCGVMNTHLVEAMPGPFGGPSV